MLNGDHLIFIIMAANVTLHKGGLATAHLPE
jgi:hypothetical protein